MGIIHSTPDVLNLFLEKVEIPKDLLLHIDAKGNSLLHLICKHSDIGKEIL